MSDRHDPAVVTAVLAGIEVALNKTLALDVAAARELAEMAGTVIAIECLAPAIDIFVRVEEQGSLALSSYCEAQVATRVRGSLDDFLGMAGAEDPAAALINSDLEIIGNTAPLLALQGVVSKLQPDWEAPLVDTLGDVVGHQLAQTLRKVFRWGKNSGASLQRQLSEFILEEGQLSPPAAEQEALFQGIESLALRVDRLEARLRRLARRLERPAT